MNQGIVGIVEKNYLWVNETSYSNGMAEEKISGKKEPCGVDRS